MDSSITISVIICTYNRASSLGKTLESIAAQSLPEGTEWEIVVVDNNSKDATQKVVEQFQSQFPGRFLYVMEERPGVSYARNTGIREAKGEILAFIDDDETAALNWLRNLTSNLHSGEWAGAGGPVVSQWDCPRPRWLVSKSPFVLGPLSAFQFEPDPKCAEELTTPPLGANMAFRKEVFESYGGFRTDLGRVGKQLFANEDTELGRRLMDKGKRIRWEPLALIYHPVDERRTHRKYFLAWWFNKSRSDIRELGDQEQGKRFFPILLRTVRNILVEAVRWCITFDPAARFICILKIWAYAGQAVEHYHQLSDAKRKGTLLNSNARP
jgi:glycosyltransferase involved in cell wall biosynthesis